MEIETSKSPDISLFSRFRDNFRFLSSDETESYQYAEDDDRAEDIRFMCKRILASDSPIRGDYKEVLQLTLMYLDHGNTIFTIQAPGAIHKARWMAKILYSIKMLILNNKIIKELPKDAVFRTGQLNKLKRYVKFIIYVYLPWLYTCSFTEDSPRNDLTLFRAIQNYEDKLVSKSAYKAFSRHTWYLTEELILLALFSDSVSIHEKQVMADKLMTYPDTGRFEDRHGTGFGKPVLPSVEDGDTLESFIGPSSWHFFQKLGIRSSFLRFPAESWESSPQYKSAVTLIKIYEL